MSDSFKFKCEVCGKSFEPNPDTMVECSIDVDIIDDDTGEVIELSSEEREELIKDAAESDPEIAMFSKGAICMCIECQDKWIEDADHMEPIDPENET
jgi:hypothetical protein